MPEFKCKICQSTLKSSSGQVYWCRNNSSNDGGHYYLILDLNKKKLIAEAWLPDFPNRWRLVRQDYNCEPSRTFITLYFGFKEHLYLNYCLFDFDNFSEKEWFDKIEILAFYA